ncbi:DUF4387 domain-containing protein [Limobrevibacterium gyesilva]|uniref:DUF4387 domain-containing protein n=1 Tax=Limobrevibacterium gyesilva TaxID=2991712 RepID=A0AA41YQB1_9PROT|nr:DUF4387 domain-containing protein [Limobrevibacterium gyesilva]MCW3474668.1 DUF4387 domain-containing protein [Limobrevibacterium gyesilva]
MQTLKLSELAKTIRSKNAGVDRITFDIIFRDARTYNAVRRSGAVSRDAVLKLYGLPAARLTDFVEFDAACAIKFTIARERPSGSPGDPDIFGAQQYAPLLDVVVTLPDNEAVGPTG